MTAIDLDFQQMRNRHCSEEFRAVALDGMILRCQVGSGVHGTNIEGTDDRDEMGICTEPPQYVIGLSRFSQYVYRTKPEGCRSGPGDLDLVVYGLRKWASLALNGNPSVLLPLFVPESEIVTMTPLGADLRAHAGLFLSRVAADRFAGYLHAQRRGLLSRDGKGRDVTRPELIERYGWDTKFGGHMVRLGVQGAELLETGRITLPVPEPWRTVIREIRTGRATMAETLDMAAGLEQRIRELAGTSPLSEKPAREAADEWLVSVYRQAWEERAL
jgi:uncharacterized protein